MSIYRLDFTEVRDQEVASGAVMVDQKGLHTNDDGVSVLLVQFTNPTGSGMAMVFDPDISDWDTVAVGEHLFVIGEVIASEKEHRFAWLRVRQFSRLEGNPLGPDTCPRSRPYDPTELVHPSESAEVVLSLAGTSPEYLAWLIERDLNQWTSDRRARLTKKAAAALLQRLRALIQGRGRED